MYRAVSVWKKDDKHWYHRAGLGRATTSHSVRQMGLFQMSSVIERQAIGGVGVSQQMENLFRGHLCEGGI